LKLEIPESLAAHVRRGQVVTLQVEAFPSSEFKGRIARINPSVDEKNRSLVAEADVPNPQGQLRPGMFARAQIATDTEIAALLVPEKAVVSLAGVNKVFVLEGTQAVERHVKLGTRDGVMVEILEGVRSGERVIVSNTDKLYQGVSVAAS
jgi:membrane fusion protein (multidrug efflux system)